MTVAVRVGDCRAILADMPAASVHCVVTSPPYFGLRDYGVDGQIGLEPTLDDWLAEIVSVFREVRRVLRDDGTLWLNLGDSYNAYNGGAGPGSSIDRVNSAWHTQRPKLPTGHGLQERALKPKDLMMLPARVALALQADGWWLRSEIIWAKPNPMPESVTDRPTSAHEKVFLLSKSARYFYDTHAAREKAKYGRREQPADTWDRVGRDAASVRGATRGGDPNAGRNLRNIWTIPTFGYGGAHFATFPPALVERCIAAGCPKGGTVLDPFAGAGTTGLVADRLERHAILIELNPEYAALAHQRLNDDAGMFADVRQGLAEPSAKR